MFTIGLDIGSSSVKGALYNIKSGKAEFMAQYPKEEAPISSPKKGWAEQSPDMWWEGVTVVMEELFSGREELKSKVQAVGISYQMHGLVTVDSNGTPLRDAIIWCDSRAVTTGEDAYQAIGKDRCNSRLLNSPGNFTASKLAWVKENEPELFAKIYKVMLPGDYIAYKLTGDIRTTISGLSEGIFWDFKDESVSEDVMNNYGLPKSILADIVPTFGDQGTISEAIASQFGLPNSVTVTYRGGDQPNNALSLNVLEPGEVASTAGTSGVVYGISDELMYDPQMRVNSFAHVNYTPDKRRIGVLLCINGTGIMNSWVRKNFCPHLGYDKMNELAANVEAGSNGVLVYPFGNGAERVLGNTAPGASVTGLDLNRHSIDHVIRATQEGIAYSFAYGITAMKSSGVNVKRIKAGKANMFLSPIFRQTLSNVTGVEIELYDTDGSLGAAKGAVYGAGLSNSLEELFSNFKPDSIVSPDRDREKSLASYKTWETGV